MEIVGGDRSRHGLAGVGQPQLPGYLTADNNHPNGEVSCMTIEVLLG